jgi:ribonuclease P protein component
MARLVSLKRKREFDAVFQRGRRGGNRSLGVLVMAGEPGAGVRYGLVVSRKNAGNAVRRNKIRRRMREALWLLLKDSAADLDIVLIGRAGALELTFQEIVALIRRTLPRALLPPQAAGPAGAKP